MPITDKDYRRIVTYAYEVDPVDNPDKQLSIGENIDVNGRQFQVIDATGNSAEPTDNSMQAMAVAPLDANGNVDYSQVVVSYVGTNFSDKLDVLNDIENLGFGFQDKMFTDFPSMWDIGKRILSGEGVAESTGKETIKNTVDVQSKTAVEFAQRVEKRFVKKIQMLL
ncbi:hypothetical protein STRDD11_02307 [Streptococcus sp. DD11]|uniref:hypothetical protein n=1 Tax=Streptococcus sp. DD11 TaxID=1777879 RepID=UPI0007976D24|nr:hypothetical protein [Streptococcus sp. DD11]KXT79360.1 hypothetical protein STRDD11_02307 [Streptococcus sp. DD11]